jgi:hypothetical protein
MKIQNMPVLAGLVAGLCASVAATPALAQTCKAGTALTYPATKKVEQIDDYHGTKVADPYRWLEDANSAETAAWVAAENKVTQSVLPGPDPAARADQGAPDQALELRALRRAVQGRRPLFLQP